MSETNSTAAPGARTPGRIRPILGRLRLRARLGLWRAGIGGWPSSGGRKGLAEIEAAIARTLPDVPHVTPGLLEERIASGAAVAVIDVRNAEEFAVSRIAGSRAAAGVRLDALSGDVVLVCAVGVRSALLASRLAARRRGGTLRLANLSGGLFRWHGEGRPLVDDQGPTCAIHPYGRRWGRFVAGPERPSGG